MLALGPALGPGYVLSYDMVWVPDLALRVGDLGLGTGLPRAVPSDAVVAVLDEVLPGQLLQKLVLLGSLLLAGAGIARLAERHGLGLAARLVAVSVFVWNPFVAERLWIGHWPLLVAYAVLPWAMTAARDLGAGRGGWPAVAAWLPWGCLSPSAGLLTAVAVIAGGARLPRGRGLRHDLLLAAAVVVANLPWLLTGLLHAADATTSGASVFAVQGEGRLPTVLAVLGLGGIWNTDVVPASREGAMAWVSLVGMAALVAVGARSWWRRSRRTGLGIPLVVCWGAGLLLALVPAAVPGLLDAAAGAVPGLGLLRDGGRALALCAPLLALSVACGAETLTSRTPGAVPRVALFVGLALFPVMVLPDLAWGIGGALRPVTYPESYAVARSRLAEAEKRRPGDVLVLPFTSYRAPSWNGGRKVFDPTGRYLTPDDVTSDVLAVDDRMIPGEDPRGPQVEAALSLGDAAARSRALGRLGIGYVAVDQAAPPALVPELGGRDLYAAPDIRVIALAGDPHPRRVPSAWWWGVGLAWAGWLTLIVAGAVGVLRRAPIRKMRNPPTRW